jgi:hypothetical protein
MSARSRIRWRAGGSIVHLNFRQQSLLAGSFCNFAILLMGISMTDQPFMSHAMTYWLRIGIMTSGIVFVAIGLWVERIQGGSGHD